MAAPFATASDLALRLKRSVWTDPGEVAQVEQFLEDASNDLRDEIGWQVYPPVEVTVDVISDWRGTAILPGSPVASIASVSQYGVALPAGSYEWRGGLLHLGTRNSGVSVTYTVGYTAPPATLVRWTCVLAAQYLAAAADDSLGGGTPSSEALADYRISYSERQQLGELPIPRRVLERLRSSYGQAVFSA